jgi:hypothetical protein
MALVKEIIEKQITADDMGIISIKESILIKEDDVQISENIHMRMLEPSVKDGDNWIDTDISNESSKVQAICNAVWTDELKAAYQEHLNNSEI